MKPLTSRLIVVTSLVLTFTAVAAAQKVGGYKEVSVSDAGVKAAAAFAVTTQAEESGRKQKLLRIQKAERQVVAGSNYRLCIKIISEGGEDQPDIIHFVQAIVYVDLKGVSKLMNWRDSNCGGDDDD